MESLSTSTTNQESEAVPAANNETATPAWQAEIDKDYATPQEVADYEAESGSLDLAAGPFNGQIQDVLAAEYLKLVETGIAPELARKQVAESYKNGDIPTRHTMS